MLDFITRVKGAVNNFVWGVPAMVLIMGVGLYLTLRLRFVQIRRFGHALRNTIGKIFHRGDAAEGSVTPFQAVCTALAAPVGTGNIAGVAGAIAIGGPGAVFWMWVSALLVALVLLGGIRRIGRVAERLVPFMALLYVVLGLGVVALNLNRVPAAFAAIFRGAFNPAAVTGGVVGAMFTSMKKGVSRGIFSNEAGLGTASIAHASAHVDGPVKQGLYGVFEVFADTIVICTLTALVILLGAGEIAYGQAAGAELTIRGFTSTYGGWVSLFTAVAMCSFAFSTILGWGLYGTRCIEFMFGSRVNKPFMLVYSAVAILGATVNLGLLWNIADTFNGLMVIPNLIAVALLSPVAVKLIREYFADLDRQPRARG